MNLHPKGKWYVWILMALAVKGIMFLLLAGELGSNSDTFVGIYGGDEGGDTHSYLSPVENLISHGSYSPDYRMPGYAAPYFLLRQFFGIPAANNMMVLLQSLLAAISVYVLGLSAMRMFGSLRMFYLVYFAFLFSTYSQLFDLYILTESLTVSVSIFAVYFLVKGIQEETGKDLIYSGLFTTWAIFLRPVYAPFLLLFVTILVLYHFRNKKRSSQKIVTRLFLFVLPFFIIDGIWITRNFRKYSTIQPLTKSVYYPDAMGSYFTDLMEFLQSWGGSYIFWDPSAEIRLLGIENSSYGPQLVTSPNVKIPESIYTKEFNSDSLLLIRSLVSSLQAKKLSEDSTSIVNEILKEKLRRYTLSVKEEHPFTYQVTSRLKYLKIFVLHSGTYNLMHQSWADLGLVRKLLKLFYSALYIFVLIAGITGSIMLLFRHKNALELIPPAMALYCLLIFPLILRLPEMRYFVPTYPFMLICAMYVTNKLISRFIRQHPVNYPKS